MSGQLKGRVALAGLALLLAGFGFALATAVTVRVRYWEWRMGSSERGVRVLARRSLLEIGRPAIDRVLPELVAAEVCERLATVPRPKRLVVLSGGPTTPVVDLVSGKPWKGFMFLEPVGSSPDGASVLVNRIEQNPDHWIVVAERSDNDSAGMELLTMPLPREADLARAVIEETKARLEIGR
ncbi:MAG TPA: hypothetical protein VFF73_11505 [Planctomycetota bacterium]|nr:hypothetical protein [Planctomycetota bacterium]